MRRSIFLLCIIGVACGGAVTSVDGNKNTSTLSPTDQTQLCTDVYDYIKGSLSAGDIARLSCGLSVSNSTDPTSCQSSYAACVTEETPAITTSMSAPPDCATFAQELASCNTTVATYTKCLAQEIDAMKSMESQVPLCTQSAAQAAELSAMSKLTADCLALANSCKFLAIGSSSSSGGGSADGGLPDGG